MLTRLVLDGPVIETIIEIIQKHSAWVFLLTLIQTIVAIYFNVTLAFIKVEIGV